MKHPARLAIQLLASIALMWVLLSHIGIEQVAARLTVQKPIAAGIAILLLSLQLVVCMLRWRMVCTALGVRVPSSRLTLGWVGLGFALSQILPSSIGGDGYRIVALGRRAGLADAARTVVADRVAGLLTLSALALPMSLAAIPGSRSSTAFGAFAIAAAAVLIAGLFAAAVTRVLARWTASRLIRLVAADFGTMYSRATLLPVFAMSLAIHALSISIVVCLAAALSLDEVLWWQAALAVPGTLLATALPVSLGGWGIRESSMVLALTAFGVSDAAALALSITYGLAMVATAVIGVGLWLAGGHE